RHADGPGAAAVQRIDEPRVGGVVRHDGVPRRHFTAQQEVKGLLTAGGDQYLLRRGGDAVERGEHRGDGRAQLWQPVRKVAAAESKPNPFRLLEDAGRVVQRGRDLGSAVDAGQGEVVKGRGRQQAGEETVRAVHRRGGNAVRDQAGARALTARRHALVAQHLVGERDRVPRDRQGRGEGALRRQPDARGQLAGVGQPADPRGEQPVQRAVRRRPATEQVSQRLWADRRCLVHFGVNWHCHDSANDARFVAVLTYVFVIIATAGVITALSTAWRPASGTAT